MTSLYRFLKTSPHGVTAFAAVELSSAAGQAWTVSWDDALAQLQPVYGAAVAAGVQLARAAYEQRNGAPQQVVIQKLLETTADTTDDAVACATALALWKEWDCPASAATIAFDDGHWRVRFEPAGA